MKLFVYSQLTCIFVSSKNLRLQWYSTIPYASSAQPQRPLSCITLHFGMGFVYLLQLTVEKLYKKLVYSDGIGHLKVNWNYIFIYIIYFFFLVQAQNIKQLRPWFHPKWPYCIEKKYKIQVPSLYKYIIWKFIKTVCKRQMPWILINEYAIQ